MKGNAGKRGLVYSLLRGVSENMVTTYGELARAAGTHPRAVSVFMKTNKDPVSVPCFKVVRSNGEVGGYSGPGGVRRKIELLEKSGIVVRKGKVELEKHLHRF